MKRRADTKSPESPQKQLAAFLDKFDPDVAKLARSYRSALRRRLPTAIELVYDNYNALAIGYSASGRASDCVVSLVVTPRGPAISFYYGATLPDPHAMLQGGGNQNRYIRLANSAVLADPAVETLVRAAVAQAKTPMPERGGGVTIIRSVSAKQRPRRPTRHD